MCLGNNVIIIMRVNISYATPFNTPTNPFYFIQTMNDSCYKVSTFFFFFKNLVYLINEDLFIVNWFFCLFVSVFYYFPENISKIASRLSNYFIEKIMNNISLFLNSLLNLNHHFLLLLLKNLIVFNLLRKLSSFKTVLSHRTIVQLFI